jgi:hypothetical protein
MSEFFIPELMDLLALHLSNQDLVHCCLVNKFWNVAFTPSLWRALPSKPTKEGYDHYFWAAHVYKSIRPLLEGTFSTTTTTGVTSTAPPFPYQPYQETIVGSGLCLSYNRF